MGLFGPKKMVLNLERFDYKPGDTIKGTVRLQLKKPTNARSLDVGLIGRKIEHHSSYRSGMYPGSNRGRNQNTTQYVTIYDFRIPLGSEQEYHEDMFPFEIKIPPTILQGESHLQGNLAAAVNVLKTISGVSSRVEWMVVARLDLPMKLDVSASQKIVLS